jgi:hypothetical protein
MLLLMNPLDRQHFVWAAVGVATYLKGGGCNAYGLD